MQLDFRWSWGIGGHGSVLWCRVLERTFHTALIICCCSLIRVRYHMLGSCDSSIRDERVSQWCVRESDIETGFCSSHSQDSPIVWVWILLPAREPLVLDPLNIPDVVNNLQGFQGQLALLFRFHESSHVTCHRSLPLGQFCAHHSEVTGAFRVRWRPLDLLPRAPSCRVDDSLWQGWASSAPQ